MYTVCSLRRYCQAQGTVGQNTDWPVAEGTHGLVLPALRDVEDDLWALLSYMERHSRLSSSSMWRTVVIPLSLDPAMVVEGGEKKGD